MENGRGIARYAPASSLRTPGTPQVPNTWEHVPVYARAGAILVRKARARRSTSAQVRDPYSLSVYLDAQGEARTALCAWVEEATAHAKGQ